jgi:hypothetical protein
MFLVLSLLGQLEDSQPVWCLFQDQNITSYECTIRIWMEGHIAIRV